MRRLTFLVASIILAAASGAAHADPQSYCEVYSKDFADIRTSNADQWQLIYRSAFDDCMISYNAKPATETVAKPVTPEVTDAPAIETEAAIAEPAAEPSVGPEDPAVMKAKKKKATRVAARAKPAAKKATVKPAPDGSKSRSGGKNLTPGSDEWNNYCAAKYSSFNKLNGTYLSNSGKIRRCR